MKKSSTLDTSSRIMEQIKSGKVKMKPRIYYVLLYIISLGAIFAAGVTIAYLSSIIFFWIRIQTANTMAWGARQNLGELTASFPWWAIAVSIVLIVAVVWLVRRHGRLYRHKISTLVLMILTSSLLLGLLLSTFGIGGHAPNPPTERGRGPGPMMQMK